MSRSRSVAIVPSSHPASSQGGNPSSPSSLSPSNGGVHRLFECFFFVKYTSTMDVELEYDYPKGYFHRFNVLQYISKLSSLNTFGNVIFYRVNNANIYCKYIPRVGILGVISKHQPYYSFNCQLLLILYNRMILNDFSFQVMTPFIEYLYHYQPYPKYGEKFLVRYDTKNPLLDSTHYLRRPSIDEFTGLCEINLLKLKPFMTSNDFLRLYKVLLLDKFAMAPHLHQSAMKIVVFSKNSHSMLEMMNFIYSMTSLIYPFKYCGELIPFTDDQRVVEHIINNRHSTSIVGYIRSEFNLEKYLSSNHVIVFNLDELCIMNNQFPDLIALPKESKIKVLLSNNITKCDSNERILDFFVKCMAKWLGNYRNHFKMSNTVLEFVLDDFLHDEHFPESKDFYIALSHSLIFKIFIEERTKLINDYATFQIQKIQFGKFEQECFKINPRIYSNAATINTTTNFQTAPTPSNTSTTNTTPTVGTSSSMGKLPPKNANNGFFKQLFFKKTPNSPMTMQPTSGATTSDKQGDESNEHKSERATISEPEPMNTSFGQKLVSELQFSKDNQLSISYYCKESDAVKSKFSFSEYHQLVKPPRKYLPLDSAVPIKSDVESMEKELDVVLNSDNVDAADGADVLSDGFDFGSPPSQTTAIDNGQVEETSVVEAQFIPTPADDEFFIV